MPSPDLVELVCPKCGRPIASAVRTKVAPLYLAMLSRLNTMLRAAELECVACRPLTK